MMRALMWLAWFVWKAAQSFGYAARYATATVYRDSYDRWPWQKARGK